VGFLRTVWLGVTKTGKIKKVTTSRDDKGEGGDSYWEPLDRDGQKETAGQIRLKLDDLAKNQ
jgi:hypothetical protein